MERTKILFITDSIKRKTGYATVARNVISHLVKTGKYEIAQLGLADVPAPVELPIHYYSLVKLHKDKCCGKGKVIEYVAEGDTKIQFLKLEPGTPSHQDQRPCVQGGNEGADNYGYISVYFVAQHFRPDIIIPINDVWGLYNLCHLRNRRCFKLVPYMAIDSECMFPEIAVPNPQIPLPPVNAVKTILDADKTIVFTNWAQSVLNKAAKIMTGNELPKMSTVPHGVDTSVWRPLENKQDLRSRYFKNLPRNAFLVGSIARNQPRKRLDAVVQTLRYYIDHYEKDRKIYAYFHCALDDRLGWPLPWIAQYYNVLDRCIFDKNLKPGVGPTDEQLNEITNCFDAHLSLTNSEGWHLPALETAAAGIPNVITDYSAHADWGKDALLLVKVAAFEHEPRTGFIKAIADIKDAAKKLKLLSEGKKYWKEWSDKGVKLGNKLEWSNVCKMWEKELDKIDISDLDPERYDDAFVSNPSAPDFSLKFFPKAEDQYDHALQEQV